MAEVIAYASNKLYLNGGGQLIELQSLCDFDEPSWQAADMVAFDADDDGDVDLAVANDSAPADLYLNDGLGCFSRTCISRQFHSQTRTARCRIRRQRRRRPRFGCWCSAFSESGYLSGLCSPGFCRVRDRNCRDLSGVSGYENAAVFDANGDGGQDVLMIEYYGGTGLYLHDGYGSFQLTEAGELDDLSFFPAAAFDADGDGDFDVASSGPNYLFLNDGSGVFTRGAFDDFAAAGAIRIRLLSMRISTGMSIWLALRPHDITPAPSFSTMEPGSSLAPAPWATPLSLLKSWRHSMRMAMATSTSSNSTSVGNQMSAVCCSITASVPFVGCHPTLS